MNEFHDGAPSASPDLAAALAELANLMLATPSFNRLLDDLARLAAEVITPPAVCGITLQQDHLPLTVSSSGPLAAHLDEVQYGQDQGPCLQAMRTGMQVSVPDLAVEERWGAFPAHAISYGARSSMSLPLTANGQAFGALNLYATVPHAFGPHLQQRATVFAAQASAVLAVTLRQAQQVHLTSQLNEALATRAVIDQALGILMAQQHCGRDAAFAFLRGASQHQNRKLRDIAAELVSDVSGEDPVPGTFNNPTW
jgi:GAF domain-containing protein